MAHYFFTGIAGSAMNALALYLRHLGHQVSGSDRFFDLGQSADIKQRLEDHGVKLYPQDGSGVTSDIDALIYTRVVDPDTGDRAAADRLNVSQILHRYLLSDLLKDKKNICIAGTSGKTTTVSLVGYLLDQLGVDPTIFCGSTMRNYDSHLHIGGSDTVVVETDESGKDDDLIYLINPYYAVAHNLTYDHYPIEEMRPYFQRFLERAEVGFLNKDCPELAKMDLSNCSRVITYSVDLDADYVPTDVTYSFSKIDFVVNGVSFTLNLPGVHNLSNAMVAIAICYTLGYSLESISNAMKGFQTPKMRFDVIGQKNDIYVVNDFAHNKDKISSVIKSVRPYAKRVLAVFQPHTAASFLTEEYKECFADVMTQDDITFIAQSFRRHTLNNPESTAEDIVTHLHSCGLKAEFSTHPEDFENYIAEIAKPGDVILVMGARNPELPYVAQHIFDKL